MASVTARVERQAARLGGAEREDLWYGLEFNLRDVNIATAPIDSTQAAEGCCDVAVESAGCVVLLVENQVDVLKLEQLALEPEGYDLRGAASSAVALELAAAEPESVDLLVTDVLMPQMDGPKLAAAMQQQHNDLKVLYVSGCDDLALAAHGVDETKVALLRKPFTPPELAARVREVLESSPEPE